MARTNYDNEKVKELLEKAMSGRSARAYSEATGINPAIISRIKNDDYRPGKSILSKIARENPDAVSLEDLMDAAGYSESDIDKTKAKAIANAIGTFVGGGAVAGGLLFNALTVATSAGTVGGLASAVMPVAAPAVVASAVIQILKNTNRTSDENSSLINEEERKKIEQLKTSQKRFKIMAMGIIYQSLMSKNIISKTIEANNTDGEDLFIKDSLLIAGDKGDEKRLDLFFAHYDDGVLGRLHVSKEDLVVAVLSTFAFDEPDKNKQIDIITDNKEYYETLAQFAHRTSIKANIVAVLLDTENTEIIKEDVVSTYGDTETGLIHFVRAE